MSKHSEVPMTDRELMQMALNALESDCGATKFGASEALRARLAQPEQPDFSKAGFGKPQNEEGCAECGKKTSDGWALYCVKCSEREWVGLDTSDFNDFNPYFKAEEAARWAERKLKEKNI